MREILFRGKSVETGEWEYGDLVHFRGNKLTYIHTTYGEAEIYREVDPDTVGRYTGKKNIDGDFIFEGDIFKLPNFHEFGFGVVRWNKEEARFYIETVDYCYDMSDITPETKVVGNVWDNPELLKGLNI